jgi:hypothetical protein
MCTKFLPKKLQRKSLWTNSGEVACENVKHVQLAEDRVKTIMKFWFS